MVAILESGVRHEDGQTIVLSGVTWATYVRLRRDEDNSRLRMTFDQGVLEIMSPSFFHERACELLSDCVKLFARRRGIRNTYGGATTFRRKDLEKGLEPDQCFWIKNVAKVRGKQEINLLRDPPPDLVLEVDISSSSDRRMALYSALGVPEVWRYDIESLTVMKLGRDESYRPARRSACLPDFPLEIAFELLGRVGVDDLSDLVDEFERLIAKGK